MTETSWLAGKLFDDRGERLSPSHANKRGRRYRYYVSASLIAGTSDDSTEGWRVPAEALERVVLKGVSDLLCDEARLATTLREAGIAPEDISSALQVGKRASSEFTQKIIQRIALHDDGLVIGLDLLQLAGTALPYDVQVPMRIKRRGCEMRLVIGGARAPKPDSALVKAIARARRWFEEIASGQITTARAIAEREGITERYVGHLMPLAFLAPDIVETILEGRQPIELTTDKLVKHIQLPLDWQEQRIALGFG